MAKTPKTEKPDAALAADSETAAEQKYPRRTERRKRTRLKILDVAVQLFSKSGFAATTMQNIADEADVHVTTLFMHFNSKGELATQLVTEGVNGLQERAWSARGTKTFFEFYREEALAYAAVKRGVTQTDAAFWTNLRKDQDLAFAWTIYEHGQKNVYADYIAAEHGIDRAGSYLADLVAALVVESLILAHERWASAPSKYKLAEEIEKAVYLTERSARLMLSAD